MGFKLITEYPVWLFPLCLLAGLGFALLLYYRNKADDYPRGLLRLLFIFRFLSVSVIAFLLLSPLVRTLLRTSEKPAIILGIDNSRSLVMGADSLFQRNELPARLKKMAENMDEDFQVVSYTFGQTVNEQHQPDFSENLTNIGSFFDEVNIRFYNRNIGAVVLISDGIYNAGTDPIYPARKVGYPVYTVNLGDTLVRRDLIVQRVAHNQVAYKGNRFPIEVIVHAREAGGMASKLKVLHDQTEIFSKELSFTSDNQVISTQFMADAAETGMIRLRISLEAIDGEINTANNVREIFVEVKESRQKIAIVANAPHPDLAAISRAIGNSNNFETELFYSSAGFNKNPREYSLFILHQLPSVSSAASSLTDELQKENIPVLFILGSQSDIARFNRMKSGLALVNQTANYNEALPVINADFPLFTVGNNLKQLLNEAPPLISPFAQYQQANSAYTLVYQGIGALRSDMPLILFNQSAETRYGVVAGEGIWKWRLTDFNLHNNFQAFDELIGKMVQYLSVEADKGRLNVSWRSYYAENEPIEFNAVLYNETYEPITDPEIQMVIRGENDRSFDFTFSATGDNYYLNAGNLPPGMYSFAATAITGSGDLSRKGSFTVTSLNLEDINTVANHQLLNSIAAQTGGQSILPDQLEELPGLLKARGDLKPVIYTRKRFTDLVNFYPLLILIILLLGTEWFLRKYHGSY